MKNINFKLAGLTCEACLKLATNRLKKVPGVIAVKIDLASGDTTVSGEDNLDKIRLAESLAGTHYSVIN